MKYLIKEKYRTYYIHEFGNASPIPFTSKHNYLTVQMDNPKNLLFLHSIIGGVMEMMPGNIPEWIEIRDNNNISLAWEIFDLIKRIENDIEEVRNDPNITRSKTWSP